MPSSMDRKGNTLLKLSAVSGLGFLVAMVAVVKGDKEFNLQPEFNGTNCIPLLPVSAMDFSVPNSPGGESKIACASQCSLTTGCEGVFYNEAKMACVGGSQVFTDPALCQNEAGSVYYTLVETTAAYSEECDDTVPCSGNNTGCWQGHCVCKPGYSLLPAEEICVENCGDAGVGQGLSAQGYPGWLMGTWSLITYTDNTELSECIQHCLDWSTCTGFNFDSDTSVKKCILKEHTPLTYADLFLNDGSQHFMYYHMNCQWNVSFLVAYMHTDFLLVFFVS